MGKAANDVFEGAATARPILDTTAKDLLGLLNTNNYQKGAWVLHQLRGIIGDSSFYAGLRRYYDAYRDSTALSADFARIMSQASGRDLEWFFRQALSQPGYPMLDVRWQYQGKKLTVDIAQTQNAKWGAYGSRDFSPGGWTNGCSRRGGEADPASDRRHRPQAEDGQGRPERMVASKSNREQ